jgi:hypothetical protein
MRELLREDGIIVEAEVAPRLHERNYDRTLCD